MTNPLDLHPDVEKLCRGWWDCPDKDGKRIATIGWDEFAAKRPDLVPEYRRRMTNALNETFINYQIPLP